MSEPFLGEIRIFAGNFAPRSWALCDGQLLAIAQNDALFSLLGTLYGGDGRTTFGLPDLRGRVPIHFSAQYRQGIKGGMEQVSLTLSHLPPHTHRMQASADPANSPNPGGNVLAEALTTTPYIEDAPTVPLASEAVTTAGGSQAHNNLQPYVALNYIIAISGIYPSRT